MTFSFFMTAALLLAAAALAAAFYYHPRRQPVLYILRTFSLFLLLLFLWNPLFVYFRQEIAKPSLYILADASRSTAPYRTVIDSLSRLWTASPALHENFRIHFFYFTDTINRHRSALDTSRTDIGAALQSLLTIHDESSPAAVLLLTDGLSTAGADYTYENWTPLKIFPVPVGDTTPRPDLKIDRVDVNPVVFWPDAYRAKISISVSGLKRAVHTRLIMEENGVKKLEKTLKLTPSKNFDEFTFTLRPSRPGIYRLRWTLKPLPSEANLMNNSRTAVVEVVDRQTKILILTGKIHPDAGAVRRILERRKTARVEVARRLDGRKTYDLVIALQPQQTQIKDLAKYKGPVWWITGTHTDWGALNRAGLPFRKSLSGAWEEFYFPVPNSAFDLFDLPPPPPEGLPPLRDRFGPVHTSPGTRVAYFARIKNTPASQPLWAFFPERRQALTAGEGIWQWYMDTHRHGDTTFVRELVEKTAAFLMNRNDRNQLQVRYRPEYIQGEKAEIRIIPYNRLWEINTTARLQFPLTDSTGRTHRLPLYFRSNAFTVPLDTLKPGTYRFVVRYDDAGLRKEGIIVIRPPHPEQPRPVALNKLRTLARKTGGKVIYPHLAGRAPSLLVSRTEFKPRLRTTKTYSPLTGQWILLIIWLLLMTAEWFYRKYKGFV